MCTGKILTIETVALKLPKKQWTAPTINPDQTCFHDEYMRHLLYITRIYFHYGLPEPELIGTPFLFSYKLECGAACGIESICVNVRFFYRAALYGHYLPTVILTIIWYSITHQLFHSRLKTYMCLFYVAEIKYVCICSFSANHSHRSPFFLFFRIHYMYSPDCLLLFLSISVFYFLVIFCFYTF